MRDRWLFPTVILVVLLTQVISIESRAEGKYNPFYELFMLIALFSYMAYTVTSKANSRYFLLGLTIGSLCTAIALKFVYATAIKLVLPGFGFYIFLTIAMVLFIRDKMKSSVT